MAYHPHKRVQKNNHKGLDKLVSIVAIVSPAMTLPQVHLIYSSKSAEGVSLFSWVSYVVMSGIWLFYGLAHKEKPIIVNSILGGALSLVVVFGITMFS